MVSEQAQVRPSGTASCAGARQCPCHLFPPRQSLRGTGLGPVPGLRLIFPCQQLEKTKFSPLPWTGSSLWGRFSRVLCSLVLA